MIPKRNGMKETRRNKSLSPSAALRLLTRVSPLVPEPIRRLLNARYSAKGGPDQMTLDDWRDLELELDRRLKHEREESQV